MSAGFYFFFFQAEDGIRDLTVTGVQTCALPGAIALRHERPAPQDLEEPPRQSGDPAAAAVRPGVARRRRRARAREIGRASCRKSVDLGGRRIIKKKTRRRIARVQKSPIEEP